jgi:hypothetical protein
MATKKAEDSRVLGDLFARRDLLGGDARAISDAASMSWLAVKDKVDRDVADYKSLSRTASARIRSAPR